MRNGSKYHAVVTVKDVETLKEYVRNTGNPELDLENALRDRVKYLGGSDFDIDIAWPAEVTEEEKENAEALLEGLEHLRTELKVRLATTQARISMLEKIMDYVSTFFRV